MMMADRIPGSYQHKESPDALVNEHVWLSSAFLAATAYGAEFVLYVMTCHCLWKQGEPNKKKHIFFISYATAIFVMCTVYMAGLLKFTQEAFVDGRNIKGGPGSFEEQMWNIPVGRVVNVAMILNNWLCDIINLWRCFVVYQGCIIPLWLVIITPLLLYSGSIATGIVYLLVQTNALPVPGGLEWIGTNIDLPYFACGFSFNILTTLLLVSRLLVHRHRTIRNLGPAHSSQYTSMAAMIIESSAIYSAVALVLLASSTSLSDTAAGPLTVEVFPPVHGLSIFLLIYRLAKGQAWSHSTYATTSQIIWERQHRKQKSSFLELTAGTGRARQNVEATNWDLA